LILSVRTGTKTRNGHLWEGPWAAPIRALIGADIRSYDVLPPPHTGHVRSTATGAAYDWTVWSEVIEPDGSTHVLARHADQFYAGKAAAVSRRLGEGTVTYIGVETVSGDLEKEILSRIFTDAGVTVESHPDQFFVDWRDGFWVASNFSSADHTVTAPPTAQLIIGNCRLPPAGVAVWKE
jgi:beta-galactosidase